jgi:hypothetical protein
VHCGSAIHDSRGAVRNPVSLVGVKNRDVECGETGFLEMRRYCLVGVKNRGVECGETGFLGSLNP